MVGMRDVNSKRCAHVGCDRINPIFGVVGGKGTFCKKHALPGMFDVKSKRCAHEGCGTRPSFDVAGGKGTFCKKHALPGMRDVASKRCAHEGCTRVNPNFGVVGGKGTCCKKHKQPGMIDVVNKRCKHEGCDSIGPAFGVAGGKGEFCKTHATPEMADVKNKRCAHDGCDSICPVFDVDGGMGTFCKAHATPGMHDVKSPRCKTCKLFHVKKNGDNCATCRTGSEKAVRIELAIKAELSTHPRLALFSSHDTAHPCATALGADRIRPDFVWELADRVVVLEVDEEEHRLYELTCERARVHKLHELFGKPLILLRYNPDAPLVKLGKRKRAEGGHAWLQALLLQLLDGVCRARAAL